MVKTKILSWKMKGLLGVQIAGPYLSGLEWIGAVLFRKAMAYTGVLDRPGTRTRTHMSARSVFSAGRNPQINEETAMSIASNLLHQHIQTLVADNAHWQTLIADDLVWNSPTRPPSAIRHGSQGGRR